MKKFYMTMVAMLCGVAASAQTCTISAEDIEATAGGETAYLEVHLNESEPGTLVTGAGFLITLPQGVAVATYYDEDEEADVTDVTYPNAKKAHVTQFIAQADGVTYAVGIGAAGSTASSYFKTSTDVLIKVGLAVPAAFQNGDYLIKFTQIGFSAPDPNGGQYAVSVYPQEDFTVKLTVKGGTGINGVNAENENAPVYNMAGQRVSKTQKGVYIQNGKKVAVK